MGKNRLQYQLLHKRIAQRKSAATSNILKPQKRFRDISRDRTKQKQLSPQLIIQKTEEILRDSTLSKRGGGIAKP